MTGPLASRARPYGSPLLGPVEQSPRRLRVRVQLLLTVLLVTTNLVGVGAMLGLFVLVAPEVPLRTATVLVAAIGIPVYVAVAVLAGAVGGTAHSLAALRWANEDREPTAEERVVALRVPFRITAVTATLWGVAVPLFAGLAWWLQPDLTVTVLVTVTVAGALVTAICHQLTEFALRPVAARALAGDRTLLESAPTAGVRVRILVFWAIGTGVPVVGLVVTGVLALTRDELTRTKLAVITLVVCGVVLVFGLLIAALDARAISTPLNAVREGMRRVESGDLDVELQVYDGTELGALTAGFNAMTAGLRERERLQDLFGRHVGRDVAEAALAGDVALGGETREVSVLFVDLVGSTTYAADREPAEVVALLNRFCSVVVEEVDRRGGLVNKFMGDAVLAVFGAPVDDAAHAASALATARAVADRLAAEVPEVGAGIGVATGPAVAGNVGDRARFEYTVIGDAVNEAARLCELAKDRPGRVAVSGVSLEASAAGDAGEPGRWRTHEEVVLRGRTRPTVVAVRA